MELALFLCFSSAFCLADYQYDSQGYLRDLGVQNGQWSSWHWDMEQKKHGSYPYNQQSGISRDSQGYETMDQSYDTSNADYQYSDTGVGNSQDYGTAGQYNYDSLGEDGTVRGQGIQNGRSHRQDQVDGNQQRFNWDYNSVGQKQGNGHYYRANQQQQSIGDYDNVGSKQQYHSQQSVGDGQIGVSRGHRDMQQSSHRASSPSVAVSSPCSSSSQCNCCRWKNGQSYLNEKCSQPKFILVYVTLCLQQSNGVCTRTGKRPRLEQHGEKTEDCRIPQLTRRCSVCCSTRQQGQATCSTRQQQGSRRVPQRVFPQPATTQHVPAVTHALYQQRGLISRQLTMGTGQQRRHCCSSQGQRSQHRSCCSSQARLPVQRKGCCTSRTAGQRLQGRGCCFSKTQGQLQKPRCCSSSTRPGQQRGQAVAPSQRQSIVAPRQHDCCSSRAGLSHQAQRCCSSRWRGQIPQETDCCSSSRRPTQRTYTQERDCCSSNLRDKRPQVQVCCAFKLLGQIPQSRQCCSGSRHLGTSPRQRGVAVAPDRRYCCSSSQVRTQASRVKSCCTSKRQGQTPVAVNCCTSTGVRRGMLRQQGNNLDSQGGCCSSSSYRSHLQCCTHASSNTPCCSKFQ